MTRFDGKVAVVTGAASGIGGAMAVRLLRQGARLLLVDRDVQPLEEQLKGSMSERVALAVADVSQVADTEHYVQHAMDLFGRIDMLFANAGVEGRVSPIVECPVDAFDRVLAVNVRGVWLALKYALPHLAKTRGSVVITSSVAGLIGSPGLAAYVASKHARAWTRENCRSRGRAARRAWQRGEPGAHRESHDAIRGGAGRTGCREPRQGGLPVANPPRPLRNE